MIGTAGDSLADPPGHSDLEFHRPHARYAVQNVQRTDNPAVASFRLRQGAMRSALARHFRSSSPCPVNGRRMPR